MNSLKTHEKPSMCACVQKRWMALSCVINMCSCAWSYQYEHWTAKLNIVIMWVCLKHVTNQKQFQTTQIWQQQANLTNNVELLIDLFGSNPFERIIGVNILGTNHINSWTSFMLLIRLWSKVFYHVHVCVFGFTH